MSAKSEHLRQTLEQLHEELESVDSVDPEVQALLQDAVSEIQTVLTTPREPAPEDPENYDSLTNRLTSAAQHFEESHPAVAGALGRVIDVLGQMGI